MAQDISGFGLVLTLQASNTYPVGIVIQDFADDADPLAVSDLAVAETQMGLNGDLIKFSKATPIEVDLAVIPGSLSDTLLAVLMEANRVAKGKTSARDVITLVGVYPNGRITRYTNGCLTDGPVSDSVASAGRMKSKVYKFKFENKGGI